MGGRREPKKSETLEVRMSHEAKSALMRKAQAEGRSASDVIRESIASYLADQPKEARSMFSRGWKPAAALGTGALAVAWSALTPSSAIAGPDFRAAFVMFDVNGDGSVTLEEFRTAHRGNRFILHSERTGKPAGPVMLPLHHGTKPPHGAQPPGAMLQADFARQDGNGNGSVDLAEFQAFHLTMFKTAYGNADLNKDGMIDRAEHEAIAAHLPKGTPKPDFSGLDGDRDGKLSEDEFFAHHH